jgi:hypothetical protein
MSPKQKNELNAQKKERGAADQAGEARQEQKKDAQQANAEKQRRYRKSMKAKGYKAKTVWEKPPEAGWVRITAPVIRESSFNIVGINPVVKEVLEMLPSTFFGESKRRGITEEIIEPVYRDLLTLLHPLGIKE